MHIRTFALSCLGLLGLMAMPESAPEAAVPQLINYQGRLTGPDGKPPATGDYTLSFSIYDSPIVGNPACTSAQMQSPTLYNCMNRVWGPQVFDGKSDVVGHGAKVPVVKGFFNVLLGPYDIDGDPISRAFTESNRFVEVTVGDDAPVLPRQQVLSAPYALKSMGEVPVGGIIMWSGSSSDLPDNWKICNGQKVRDPESPFDGDSLPNLSQRFARGTSVESEVLRTGGANTQTIPRHNHRYSGSIRIGMDRSSLNGYRTRGIFCVDENSNDSCDGDVWDLAEGTIGRIRLGGPNFIGDSRHRALVLDVHEDESHGHKGTVTGTTAVGGSFVFSRQPRYINLYYIMRIK